MRRFSLAIASAIVLIIAAGSTSVQAQDRDNDDYRDHGRDNAASACLDAVIGSVVANALAGHQVVEPVCGQYHRYDHREYDADYRTPSRGYPCWDPDGEARQCYGQLPTGYHDDRGNYRPEYRPQRQCDITRDAHCGW